jgi:uncharacterized protein YyaL (SSP411 family)
MEREADVDPVVAVTVAASFVPVRVDCDRRPDIAERYNLGGWPTNAFLTPRGDLITGGTYFDVDTFRLLVARVAQSWRERRDEVEAAIAAQRRELERRRRPRVAANVPTIDTVREIVDVTMDEFDFRYGGFGREPKFAHAPSIELLLAAFRATGETKLRDAALLSLEAMWSPEPGRPRLADAAGGFYRCAMKRDWSQPRYEKMLEENAALLSVFLSAHQLTGEARWAAAARSIVGFALATFADRGRRVFRSSQAGWPGEEYYALDVEDRSRTVPPPVDATAYTSWNARMASAFLKAGLVLGDDTALEFGAAVVDSLVTRGRAANEEVLLGHVVKRDSAEGPILLASQVNTARALVDAYEALGGSHRLATAARLLDEVHGHLFDAARETYSDTLLEQGGEGYLSAPIVPLADNCTAADTLLRLASLLDAPAYEARALTLLRTLSAYAPDHGLLAAPFALALLRALIPDRVAIYFASASGKPPSRLLVRAAHAIYAPEKTVRFLDAERDGRRLKALRLADAGDRVAVVCRGAACAEPTGNADALLALVARATALTP